ncbi:nucleoside triphosphate pyrophosphohydrolase [Clostridium sp. 19966]|uniref:nucleoside triphosphate pyrophosphohydrolase n=1 Tax=Clostridium sp. 19966 TaxID=2768166 RepID=UPI0028DF4578|nr:nucleoside triphosphate pyrophosphohydrolase [Clostridium sp. 19966]MDT8715744.1 nucleoside triphosphate pyrophosphohydrolase [Clostridium sp. 19966]
MIRVIGLGPGEADSLTVGTLKILKECRNIYMRTERHPTMDYIKELGINFETYDYAYDKFDTFDEVYNFIANDLIEKHALHEDIVYGVPGHPLVAEKSVLILMEVCKKNNIELEIKSAVSFIDVVMERLKIDPIEGLMVIDAFDMESKVLDKRIGTIITQVHDKYITSEVKIKLQEYYSDDTEIVFIRAAGVKGEESIRKIPLYELDRQEDIDHLTSIYIPKKLDDKKDFSDLLDIMSKLRAQDGCPWDREQTHESLKNYVVEEAYEVVEAIEENDYDKIVEELGDVLFQVVFHSQIGSEDGYFNINDVISAICEKMINRHPHVFGDTRVANSEEVLVKWDEIKNKEKNMKSVTEQIEHVAKTLPSLIRAYKIQEKAMKITSQDREEEYFEKINNNIGILKHVYNGNDKSRILEEIGNILFLIVKISRDKEVNPEEALNKTIKGYIEKVRSMEQERKDS